MPVTVEQKKGRSLFSTSNLHRQRRSKIQKSESDDPILQCQVLFRLRGFSLSDLYQLHWVQGSLKDDNVIKLHLWNWILKLFA